MLMILFLAAEVRGAGGLRQTRSGAEADLQVRPHSLQRRSAHGRVRHRHSGELHLR